MAQESLIPDETRALIGSVTSGPVSGTITKKEAQRYAYGHANKPAGEHRHAAARIPIGKPTARPTISEATPSSSVAGTRSSIRGKTCRRPSRLRP